MGTHRECWADWVLKLLYNSVLSIQFMVKSHVMVYLCDTVWWTCAHNRNSKRSDSTTKSLCSTCLWFCKNRQTLWASVDVNADQTVPLKTVLCFPKCLGYWWNFFMFVWNHQEKWLPSVHFDHIYTPPPPKKKQQKKQQCVLNPQMHTNQHCSRVWQCSVDSVWCSLETPLLLH